MRKHGIYLPKDIFNGKKSGITSVDQISKYTQFQKVCPRHSTTYFL